MQSLFNLDRLLAACDCDDGFDPTTHVKVPDDLEKSGHEKRLKLLANVVYDFFVKMAFVAKRPKIKFEGFEFNAELVWHVGDFDGAEVWLLRHRTHAGEFRTVEFDQIRFVAWIRKSLQTFLRSSWHFF